MSQLDIVLSRLGLRGYLEPLISYGFETWEHLVDISEDDMAELGFKLGHRRKLQRAIAHYRGQPCNQPLNCSTDEFLGQGESPTSYLSGQDGEDDQDNQGDEEPMPTKRRYRRRQPKDPHAPQQPKSSYVIFANFLRQNPQVSQLPFVEISRLVGEQWQCLLPEEKAIWTSRAIEQKSRYSSELAEYQQTNHYQRHQDLLRANEPTNGGRNRGGGHHEFPQNAQCSRSGQKCLKLPCSSTAAIGDYLKPKKMIIGEMHDEERATSHERSGSSSVS
jgi:hypothetical protein